MTPPFDGFVAVDWSGARGKAYSGIAVAECLPGNAAPKLVPSPGRTWRRSDFVEWLAGEADAGRRLLVGIDCAFALPAPTARTILGDNSYHAFDLWAHIDRICAGSDDFYGGAYADHAPHAPLFWKSGPRPAGFAELHRATEEACRSAGLGAPESPLKLLGARQVGKGGLAGMRVLAELKRRLEGDFCVWPFDPVEPARIVCAELFPRLFLRAAGHGNGKVRTLAALDRCLARLGSSPYEGTETALTDHDSDALVAAAGLRGIAEDGAVWSPAGLDGLARRAEGWIFGVP